MLVSYNNDDLFQDGGDIYGDYVFRKGGGVQLSEDSGLGPISKDARLFFRNDRTEVEGDLLVKGELLSGKATLGTLGTPVTIQGDLNIEGVLSAPNLMVSGDSLPNSPSFHNITITQHLSAVDANFLEMTSPDIANIRLQTDTIIPVVGADGVVTVTGKLFVTDAIETPRLEGS